MKQNLDLAMQQPHSFPKPAESDVKEFTFSLELFN
jgi:hypothetical protein